MGTVFSFDIREPGVPDGALEQAVAFLHRVDATFSTYRPDSEISRLDRGELAVTDCSPDVWLILAEGDRLEQLSNGFFSVRAGGRLDPSGIVKGWAIEKASDLLVAAGSRNHCVNGGGDVQCVGRPEPGRDWRIGVAHPLRPGELAAVVAGHDLAVATSGTAERGRHILDPHTGLPADGLASVTVSGPGVAAADAYATAAFAMGAGALAWLASLPGIRGLVVELDGRVATTPNWTAGDAAVAPPPASPTLSTSRAQDPQIVSIAAPGIVGR